MTVIPAIVADIRAALDQDEEVDNNEVILVYFNTYGAYSLDLMVYCYTVTTQWAKYLEVKQQVLLRCYEIIAEHGAQVAVPTTDLRVPEGLQLIGNEGEPTRGSDD